MAWYKIDYAGFAYIEADTAAKAERYYREGATDYQEGWVSRITETDVSFLNGEAHGPAYTGVQGKKLRTMYDDIMELQRQLQAKILEEAATEQQYAEHLRRLDYRTVQTLAATYELQEYLANAIAHAVSEGEMAEDEFFADAMQYVAAEEGRRAIEENERLKADPSAAVPKETHKRMMGLLCNSVAGSMALSGMELTDEDKERIRRVADDPKAAEEIAQQLIEKHKATALPDSSDTVEMTLPDVLRLQNEAVIISHREKGTWKDWALPIQSFMDMNFLPLESGIHLDLDELGIVWKAYRKKEE